VTRFESVMQIDIDLEIAKTQRECFERAVSKVMSGQLGEAWVGLDDRRSEHSPMRGSNFLADYLRYELRLLFRPEIPN
jgi:hypothetical protein